MLRVSVDIGGTFTDMVVTGPDGAVEMHKSPSTHGSLSDGVMNCFRKAAKARGQSLDALLGDVDTVIHGTTATTNALLTRSGMKTGMLTTDGFRDIIEMRRGMRVGVSPYNLKVKFPEPLVPRARRIGVAERIGPDGEIVTPLNEQQVEDAVRRLKADGCEAIAICFLYSYLRPGPREAGGGDRARGRARCFRRHFLRHHPDGARVRALQHDRGRRLCRRHFRRLYRPARRRTARGRLQRPPAADPVERRHPGSRHRQAQSGDDIVVGARRRPLGWALFRRALFAQDPLGRHGRHQLRGRPDPERPDPAHQQYLAVRTAHRQQDGRRAFDRRRRRQRGLVRSAQSVAGRAEERRLASGSGLLRPRRRRADRHRRQCPARLYRSPTSFSAAKSASIARPPMRRSARSPSAWACRRKRPQSRSTTSSTRAWPTRSTSAAPSAASIRANSCWWRAAGQGACMLWRSRARSASRR